MMTKNNPLSYTWIFIIAIGISSGASASAERSHPRILRTTTDSCATAVEIARNEIRTRRASLVEAAASDVLDITQRISALFALAESRPKFSKLLGRWEESLRSDYAGSPSLRRELLAEAQSAFSSDERTTDRLLRTIEGFHQENRSIFEHLSYVQSASAQVLCSESEPPTEERLHSFRESRVRGMMDQHAVCVEREQVVNECAGSRCDRSQTRRLVQFGLEHSIFYQAMSRGKFFNSDLLNKASRRIAVDAFVEDFRNGLTGVPSRCADLVSKVLELRI